MHTKANWILNNRRKTGPDDLAPLLPERGMKVMDAVFLQKELDEGLTIHEIIGLTRMLPADALMVPVNTVEGHATADGFVTLDGLDKIDGEEERLFGFVREIIGDMDKETPDGMYVTPDGLRVFIGYSIPKNVEGNEE